jgi:hypothetical protein
MFCSAIKHWKNWSGKLFSKISENVEFFTSPSSATTRLSALPSAASAYPYALRVDIFLSGVNKFLFLSLNKSIEISVGVLDTFTVVGGGFL